MPTISATIRLLKLASAYDDHLLSHLEHWAETDPTDRVARDAASVRYHQCEAIANAFTAALDRVATFPHVRV